MSMPFGSDVQFETLEIRDEVSEELRDTIMNSDRKFDEIVLKNLHLDASNLDLLEKIAAKYSDTVDKLAMKNCSIDFARNFNEFSNFLTKVPNLVEWNVYNNERSLSQGGEINLSTMNDIKPSLKILKTFDIFNISLRDENDDSYQTFALSKLIASGSLLRLDICLNANVRNYGSLLEAQKNLTSLNINSCTGDIYNAESYRNLELIDFTCSGEGRENFVRDLIISQPSLQKLNYCTGECWSGQFVSTICFRARNLRALDTFMSNKNAAAFLSIHKLSQLEHVTLNFERDFDHFQTLLAFSKLNMPSVKSLLLMPFCVENVKDLPPIDGATAKSALENFAKFWPHIVEFECPTKFSGDVTNNQGIVLLILQSFKKLKSLKINVYDLANFDHNQKFMTIEKLEIMNSHDDSILALIQVIPNLKEVHLEMSEKKIEIIQSLLDLKQLKKIYLKFKCPKNLSIEEMNGIKKLCQKASNFYFSMQTTNEKFVEEIVKSIQSDHKCKVRKLKIPNKATSRQNAVIISIWNSGLQTSRNLIKTLATFPENSKV